MRWVKTAGMIGGVVMALVGCMGGGGSDGVTFHRDLTVRISSSTRYDTAQFSGLWHIRGEFAHPGEEVQRGSLEFRPMGDRIAQIALMDARGKVTDIYDVDQPLPGRFTLGQKPYLTEYWVLWVDEGYRTAAIGTPSGSFGWILDRARTGGEDRLQAAKEVFGFNGYNLARLRMH